MNLLNQRPPKPKPFKKGQYLYIYHNERIIKAKLIDFLGDYYTFKPMEGGVLYRFTDKIWHTYEEATKAMVKYHKKCIKELKFKDFSIV